MAGGSRLLLCLALLCMLLALTSSKRPQRGPGRERPAERPEGGQRGPDGRGPGEERPAERPEEGQRGPDGRGPGDERPSERPEEGQRGPDGQPQGNGREEDAGPRLRGPRRFRGLEGRLAMRGQMFHKMDEHGEPLDASHFPKSDVGSDGYVKALRNGHSGGEGTPSRGHGHWIGGKRFVEEHLRAAGRGESQRGPRQPEHSDGESRRPMSRPSGGFGEGLRPQKNSDD